MLRKTTLAIGLVFASIALAATVGAATAVSGTVTVADGTADGANVTVTPMTQDFRKLDDPVRTTVDGDRFSVDVRDAPVYLVEVVHDGAVHSAVLQNETTTSIRLGRSISGRVVAPSGAPRSDATVELVSEEGFSVDRTRTDSDGSFAFGPLQPNHTYRVQATVDGAPYLETVPAEGNASVTVETPPPTDDGSVLSVSGGTPASHVLRVSAPANASGSPQVVEALTVRNTGDRPYVGTFAVRMPDAARPYAAMFQQEQTAYRETARGVAVNVTVPANSSARVGVAYELRGRTLEKQFAHDTDRIAVTFQGYQLPNVNHSANLETGDAPVPILTNADPLAANDTVRLTLPSSTGSAGQSQDVGQASASSNSMPTFPALPLFGGIAAVVAVGFVAYRVR